LNADHKLTRNLCGSNQQKNESIWGSARISLEIMIQDFRHKDRIELPRA
jgi:hypothetical protein